MSSVSPTNQDLSNDTTFGQIKSRVPVPLKVLCHKILIHSSSSNSYETFGVLKQKNWFSEQLVAIVHEYRCKLHDKGNISDISNTYKVIVYLCLKLYS